jgi:glycosyltransferase involved in cell wall biosynthesis
MPTDHDPMRILQVHCAYREPGGEDSVVSSEAALLRDGGHSVQTFAVNNAQSGVAAAASLGLSLWNPFSARALRTTLEEFQPDIVHVHNTWYTLSAAILREVKRVDVPIVMTLHNYRLLCANGLLFRDAGPCTDCVDGGNMHGVVHRCYRDSLMASVASACNVAVHGGGRTWSRAVDGFIVTSRFAGSLFERGGLDVDKFRYRFHSTADPGERRCTPAMATEVVYAGRLSAEKGADVAIDAWMRAAPPGLNLLVAGDGPLRQTLEARADASVTFLGHLPKADVRQLLLRSRALLFPSVCYETQGMAVLEALGAGVPVVASALGGTPEILGDAAAALVRAGDVEDWAHAIARLNDDDFVMTKGLQSRGRFVEKFSDDIGQSTLQAIYREFVTRPCRDEAMVGPRTA